MTLSGSQGAIAHRPRGVFLPLTLKVLSGLNLLSCVGLLSYFLLKDKLSPEVSNALLIVLMLSAVIGSVFAVWSNTQQQVTLSADDEPEETVRQNEAKIRRLIESNLIGVYVADFSGRIFESNDAFLSMVGYTRDELQAGRLNWMAMTPPQYEQLDLQALEQQRTTGACNPFEKEYLRKDGSCVSVLFGCAVFDPERQRTIGFALDLTQQKQVERALRRSEAKFKQFVESNLIGVAVAEIDGPIFEANDAYLNIVGYTRDDLQAGQVNWLEMTPPEYLESDRQATKDLRTTGAFTPFEKEYFRKDGHRVPILLGYAMADEEQQTSIGFVLDLTDRKRAESASVLEERNRIAREIHDTLAQAFTSIIVHLDVASRKLGSDVATAQKCIQTSYELAQSGLLEARRSVAALRPFYLEDQDLYSALSLLAKQIFNHSDIQLICHCDGESYQLAQDIENNLLRIGQEALNNIYKYAKATEIQIQLSYEPTHCTLGIKDNGVGFELDCIIKDDHAAKGNFGLLGMKERATHIDAEFNMKSRVGQGTEIFVTVNRRQAA